MKIERISGGLIYHPVCGTKEWNHFLYAADTLLSRRGNLLADTSSSGLLGQALPGDSLSPRRGSRLIMKDENHGKA